MRKLTFEFVKSKFVERGYKLLESTYINSRTKMRYECPKHQGLINEICYNDLRNGAGCRYCGTESCDEKRRIPFHIVKREFKKRGYILIDSFMKNSTTPLRFICPKHLDKDTRMSFQALKKGVSCAYCSGTGKYRHDEVFDAFKARGYKLLSEEYENSSTKLHYLCHKHPNEHLTITFGNFLNGQGCPFCAGNVKHTIEEVKTYFEKAGYELLEERYDRNMTPMRFRCPKHPEQTTYLSLKSLMRGTRCKYCYLDSIKGTGHPLYNHSLTEKERTYKRYYVEYYEWRRQVFSRDEYTCVYCGDNMGGNLIAHHKDGYGWCKKRRTDVSNGVTLCEKCHKSFHQLYGYKNNTEQQFNEWISQKEATE